MASYVGIDIGNNTCKVALRDGRGLRIISSRMPDSVVDEDHQIVSPETLSAHLGTLRREERIRERSCMLVLAEPEVFFRHATLPPMTAEEVLLNLPYEFRDYITGDPSSYTYDYLVDELVKDEGGKVVRMDLFIAATSRKLTDMYSNVLRKAGFRLRAVIPPQIAYARLLENRIAALGDTSTERQATSILVDIGHRSVQACVLHGSHFEASKTIDLGCQMFDTIIAELKGIDPYTAGTYKYSNFEGVLDSPECQDLCERFCAEIERVISFYNYNNPEHSISRMYLMGGGAQISQLSSAIADRVSIPVFGARELLPRSVAEDDLASACTLAIGGVLESEAM